MFVETWPSANWGVVDYLRQPKAGYFAMQRAYQPLLPSIEPDRLDWKAGQPGHINLWTINDLPIAYRGSQLEWRIVQGGSVLAQGKQSVDIAADSGKKVVALPVTPSRNGSLRVSVRIVDSENKTLARNQMEFDVTP